MTDRRKPSASRANVVVILTDDQGPWAMRCAGNSEIHTPNLDRLASEGIRFENFFCCSPVSSPARASLLTGRIPSQHGVHDWLSAGNVEKQLPGGWGNENHATEYLQGMTGYTDLLAAAGYTCGLSGKWHLGDSLKPQKGLTHWFAHEKGGGSYFNAPLIRDGKQYSEPRYVTDVITDDALEFLDQSAAGDAPFCCEVHYTAPHSPWDSDNHPDDALARYADCPFESVPNVPMHPDFRCNFNWDGSDEKRRDSLTGYFTAVTEMDRNVGRILDKLDQLGIRENTIVLFTSDNGMNMGHHGIFGKGNGTFPQNMYEESVKVPTIISMPNILPTGKVDQALHSHYDWMPTLLDFLGIENPCTEHLPGKSFAPLLRGESCPGRDEVVIFEEYGPVRMIRNERHKYIHRYPYGPHELYDLSDDPGEETNQLENPEFKETLDEMRSRLADFFYKYVNPDLDGSSLPVTGCGQSDKVNPSTTNEENFNQYNQVELLWKQKSTPE